METRDIENLWSTYQKLATRINREGLSPMLEELGERIVMCSASTDEQGKGCGPGGYLEVTLAVTSKMRILAKALELDISPESVAYASSQVSVIEVQRLDSVIALRQLDDIKSIDLLYLDSYDLTESIDSPAHHLAELASVYPRLKSGCIIAVDDCVNEEHGKHRFVRSWLASIGVEPIVSTYVCVWVKP